MGKTLLDKKGTAPRYERIGDVPKETLARLGKYITSIGGDTFVISGLPPELTGGALARYSRAQTGMQLTIVNEFLDESGEPSKEKGTKLMDRVLNAFGDESVGELEGVHVGFENISQILTKTIEDRRIGGSPIEQSTRYVRYDQRDGQGKWRYLRPKEIEQAGLLEEFERVNDMAFMTYSNLIEPLSAYFKRQLAEDSFEIEVNRGGKRVRAKKHELRGEEDDAFRIAYNFTIRCAALDVGRCVLPASTLTQLGVYGNGRFFTNLITAMKSGSLAEERLRGLALEEELKKVIPTYVKRNREDQRIGERYRRMEDIARSMLQGRVPRAQSITLVGDGDYLDRLLASALFPYATLSLAQIIFEVEKLPIKRKEEILGAYIGERSQRRDRSGRALEAGYPLVFDIVSGFAEYRDLERHRMLTQQRQLLSCDLGFIMPQEVVEIGMEGRVLEVVKAMERLNEAIRGEGQTAASQYATLFNHRMRFMLGMNLREFQHMAELRTQPAGHFSYRRMLMEMTDQVVKKYPWAKRALGFVDYSDPGNKISRAKEQSRIAGKNLAAGIDSQLDYR